MPARRKTRASSAAVSAGALHRDLDDDAEYTEVLDDFPAIGACDAELTGHRVAVRVRR